MTPNRIPDEFKVHLPTDGSEQIHPLIVDFAEVPSATGPINGTTVMSSTAANDVLDFDQ